jgi:uncharacterized protein YndB with AHSA1/START domain
MTEPSMAHATFVIERIYEAAPGRVFAAWSQPKAKARWFFGPGAWKEIVRELYFRVGGRKRLLGGWPRGPVSDLQAQYRSIVPDRRIVYAYDMYLDEKRISVSLATVEFEPASAGTRLVLTEQLAFFEGADKSDTREHGMCALLDNLEKTLRG